MDLSKFSTEDLLALQKNNLAGVSTEGLKLLQQQIQGEEPKPEEGRTLGGTLKDVGITALKGAVGLPQSIVGLADIPTFGRASKLLESAGFRPAEAQKILEQEFSPAQQEAMKAVSQAEGFLPTLKEAIKHPSVPLQMLGESLPQMIGGGLAARGLRAAAPALSEITAAGIGEGLLGAGSAAQQIRAETPEGDLSPKQSLAALLSGAGTAVFGVAGGKLAKKLKLDDIDTMIVHGGPEAALATDAKRGFFRSVIGSGISEGVFEELPQSIQEQMWQNWATDKPLTEGVGQAAALGTLVGSVAGGIGGAYGHITRPEAPPTLTQPPEPVKIDPERYKGLISAIQAEIPEGGIYDPARLMDIAKSAGLESDEEAKAYIQEAVNQKELQEHSSQTFKVEDKDKNTIFQSPSREVAEKAAANLNAQSPGSATVVSDTATKITRHTGRPAGTEVLPGLYNSDRFNIISSGERNPQPLTADEAAEKVGRLNDRRKEAIDDIGKEAETLRKQAQSNTDALESMEAQGLTNTPEYEALRQETLAKNNELDGQISALDDRLSKMEQPISVVPAKVSDDGFTVMENDKPLYYFPTEEEANEVLDQAPEPISKPTERAIEAKEALRQNLLPFLQQVGLGNTGLRIMDAIESGEGTGDGYYSSNLISVALDAPDPMGTMRHEVIHALKEMGAFTEQEWKVLENAAHKYWIDRFLKNRNTQDGRSLYEAYQAIYQKDHGNLSGFDEYITEEAIADAFKFFHDRGVPPGILGRIYKKIRDLLQAIGNAFRGLGFQTANDVFERVEGGQMRPTKAAVEGGKRYQLSEEDRNLLKQSGFRGEDLSQRYDEWEKEFQKLPEDIKNKLDAYYIADRKVQKTANDPGFWDKGARAAATRTFKSANKALESYFGRELTSPELALFLNDVVGDIARQIDKEPSFERTKYTPIKSVKRYQLAEGKPEEEFKFETTKNKFKVSGEVKRIKLLTRNIQNNPSVSFNEGSDKFGSVSFDIANKKDIRKALVNAPKVDEDIANEIAEALGLSEEEINSTSLGMQTGEKKDRAFTGPIQDGLPDTVKFLEERRRNSGLRNLDITKEEDRDVLSKLLAAEALAAIRSEGNAIQWYNETIAKTIAMASVQYPELATNKSAQMMFRLATAITSQGLNVEDNLKFAMEQYEASRQNNRFPIRGTGESAEVMEKNFELVNKLLDKYDSDIVRRFFNTEFTAKELNAAGLDVDGELADEKILGSSVLGPKIGFGFYSNLNGNFNPVTMDMWFMRTIGRLTGFLRTFKPERFNEQVRRLRNSLDETGDNGLYSNSVNEEFLDKPLGDVNNIINLATEVKRLFEKDFKNNRAQYDDGSRIKTDLVLSSEAIIKELKSPKDAPSSGGERRLLRDVVRKAVNLVSEQQGKEVPPAAMQALVWYPEQELYKALGVKLRVTSQDYAGAINKLLSQRGYDEQTLRAAAQSGSRLARQVAARNVRQGHGGVREQARASYEEGFDAKRREGFLVSNIIRHYRESNENAPRTYTGGGAGDAGRLRLLNESGKYDSIEIENIYKPKIKFKNVLDVVGSNAPDLYEIKKDALGNGAKKFQELIKAAKDKNKFGASVYVYPLEEYAKMRLFITKDGSSGFALKNNDIVSVFSTGKVKTVNAILQLAIDEGGRKLDAFDTVLPQIYSNNGFKVTARTRWKEQYKPGGWNKKTFSKFNNGKPDVVYMVYDPKNPSDTGGNVVEDEIQAVELQDNAIQKEGATRYSLRAPDTPAFKRWFGDSKVVDADGNPLVVYHVGKNGIPEIFDPKFRTDLSSMGFHFGTPDQAAYRSQQYDFYGKAPATGAFYLSIKNPLQVSHMASFAPDYLAEIMIDEGMLTDAGYEKIRNKNDSDKSIGSALVKILVKNNYDGLRYENEREGKGESFVAFFPEQIKSAIGNRGTFSATNKDIRYSLRAPDTPEFKRWFGDSKVVDADGNPLVMYHGTSKDKDFTSFNVGARGAWFTSSPDEASMYANENDSQGYKYEDGKFVAKNVASRVMPVYLSIQNPYVLTEDDKEKLSKSSSYAAAQRDVFSKAISQGFDGIDLGGGVWVVLKSPTQIKSAVGNRGTFDVTKKDIRYSLKSAVDLFEPEALEKYIHTGYKSRVKLIDMNIDDFLKVATPGRERLKEENVEKILNSGKKLNTIPSLVAYQDDERNGDLVIEGNNDPNIKESNNHEGRHRARALKKRGYDTMPVLLVTNIRWSEQKDKDKYDYINKWPAKIVGYDGHAVDFPISREESDEDYKTDKNIRYSLRQQAINTMGQAYYDRVNQTTYAREEEGFSKKIAAAFSPTGFEKFRQHYLNKYQSVERLSKTIAQKFGKSELYADQSAIAAALMSDRASGITAEALMHGVPVYEKGFTKVSNLNGKVKGLMEILRPLMEKYKDPFIYQEFQFYGGIRRGRRLLQEGREQNFTRNDIAYVQQLEARYPEFKQAFEDFQRWNEGFVKFLIDTGVISKEMGDHWMKYADYLPFYRQLDGENVKGPQIFQNLSGVRPTPTLEGGGKIGDFLETVIQNARAAVEQGMKNVAAQRIVRDVMRLNSPGQIQAQILPPGATVTPDVVTVRENGKDVHYRVADPMLVESMKSLHNMGINTFWQMLSYPTKALRELVTKDPAFMIANMMRDSVAAWVTSGISMTPVIDTYKQFGNILLDKSPTAKALKAAGIGTGYEFAGDTKASAKAVAAAIAEEAGVRTTAGKAMWPLKKIWNALEAGSNASDLATRAEVYDRVMKETGGNEAEAIYQALEVMNFGRMGNSPVIQVISAIVPFFNARIQGLDVLYRAGFGKLASANSKAQHKAFITRATTLVALSLMYLALARDTDEWKRANKETRDNYWIIGDVKIPIPFEVGVLFKVMPERAAEYMFGQDTGEDLAESMFRNIVSTLKVNPIPQAVLPAFEASINYSLFTGEPIVGRGMENVAPQYQLSSSTSLIAQKLGEALGVSPMKLDHVLQGYTGSIGMYTASMIDAVIRTQDDVPAAAMRMDQIPVLKRFIASDLSGGTLDEFYRFKHKVEEVVRTQHELEMRGDPDKYIEYMEKNGHLLATKSLVSGIDKELTNLRKMRNMINFSKLAPDDKREALDNIRKAEIAMTEQVKSVRNILTEPSLVKIIGKTLAESVQ